MWSGRDTLGSINQAISKLHREESSLDRALQSAMAEGERLRQERGRLMRELARVKLDEIAGGRLVSGLDAGERRAATLLEGRRARIARAAEGRDEAAARLPAAETAQARRQHDQLAAGTDRHAGTVDRFVAEPRGVEFLWVEIADHSVEFFFHQLEVHLQRQRAGLFEAVGARTDE